jgi:hypothetical protein
MARARRTSRKPVQVGKWTPRAKRAERVHRSLRKSTGSTRRGRLQYKRLKATQYAGTDPKLKGRIALDRQSGVLEFPDYEQFKKIAKDEKVPADLVEKAFGHLAPPSKRKTSKKKASKKRRTSRRKKSSSRRTSRRKRKKKGGLWAWLTSNPRRTSRRRSIRPNARRKRVRRDDVYIPHDREGEPIPLRAQTVLIPQAQVGTFGAQRGVYMAAAGETIILPYERAFQILERWLTKKEFGKAFGHLRTEGVLGATEKRRPIPAHYGPRSMKLGHRMPPGEGPPRPGIVPGQLVLYHKPTGSIMWQAYDDEDNFPHKPVHIWFGASKKHFDLDKAMSGAKVGTGDRARYVGAVDRGIPEMAMLQAFGHLLDRSTKREAWTLFSQK